MNEHEIELVHRQICAAMIHLSRASSRYLQDIDLARVAEALERANALLRNPVDENTTDHA